MKISRIRVFVLFCALVCISVPFSASGQSDTRRVEVRVDKDQGNLFWVEGRIGGVDRIPFIVDTGASTVLLAYEVGVRLLNEKIIARPISCNDVGTAGGSSRVCFFIVPELRIGDIVVQEVEVGILQRGVPVNLLGNTFLMKLKRMELRGDVITLEQ